MVTFTIDGLEVTAVENSMLVDAAKHGDVEIPDDWEYLPSGDAFLTRTVKAAGVYWLSWRPRSRTRP